MLFDPRTHLGLALLAVSTTAVLGCGPAKDECTTNCDAAGASPKGQVVQMVPRRNTVTTGALDSTSALDSTGALDDEAYRMQFTTSTEYMAAAAAGCGTSLACDDTEVADPYFTVLPDGTVLFGDRCGGSIPLGLVVLRAGSQRQPRLRLSLCVPRRVSA